MITVEIWITQTKTIYIKKFPPYVSDDYATFKASFGEPFEYGGSYESVDGARFWDVYGDDIFYNFPNKDES